MKLWYIILIGIDSRLILYFFLRGGESLSNVAEPVMKFIDDEQLVFGWASISKDKDGNRPFEWQGDIIDMEELEPAIYKFNLECREANADHSGPQVGRLVESVVFSKEKMAAMGIPEGIVPEGVWCGFKIDDTQVYKKVKQGIYKMFSIEGNAVREKVGGDE